MTPAELRDRIAALAVLANAGDDEALAQGIALQRQGRHSFQAKPKKVPRKLKKVAEAVVDVRTGDLFEEKS